MTKLKQLVDKIDWDWVREHYEVRSRISLELHQLISTKPLKPFIELLLGISNELANYSASEHGHGHNVRGHNTDIERRLLDLATQFNVLHVKSKRLLDHEYSDNLDKLCAARQWKNQRRE